MYLILITILLGYAFVAHFISYKIIKRRIIAKNTWDLNICCGTIDGGGVNADIFQHTRLPNFVLLEDVYNLPFKDKQFKKALCSHTLEHVADPQRFYDELVRVSEELTIIIPPLWDILAAFDFFEHKYIFLSMTKRHHTLPRFTPLPFAEPIQKRIGQKIKA